MSESASVPATPRVVSSWLSLLRSKTLWLATLVTAWGLASWGYREAGAERPTPVAGVASLNEQDSSRVAASQGAQAPATVRYGLSFIGGYIVMFVFRRAVRTAVVLAATLLGGIFALRALGIVDLFATVDWNAAETQVREGLDVAQRESTRVRDWLTGLLPSGAAAVVGGFFGVRRG